MSRKIAFCLFLLLLPAVAQAAPVDYAFTALDGTVYSSAQLRGRPVVIHFGAHW